MIIVILIHILFIGIELLRYFRFKDKPVENTVTAPYEAMMYSAIFLSLCIFMYPNKYSGPLTGNSEEILTAVNICVSVLVWFCNRAYFSRKIVYDEDGFTYTNALGREKRYSYGDASGVTENRKHNAVTVFIGERSIRINGGFREILNFTAQLKRGYKKASDRTLKTVMIRSDFEKNHFLVLSFLAFIGYALLAVALGLFLKLTPLSGSELRYVTMTSYEVSLDRGRIVVLDKDTERKYTTFYYSDSDEALEKVALMDDEESLTVGYYTYYPHRRNSFIPHRIFTASSDNENSIISLEEIDGIRIENDRNALMGIMLLTAVYVTLLVAYFAWYGAKKRRLMKELRTV